MKIPKDDKRKFHVHAALTLNILMQGVIEMSDFTLDEKVKFCDFISIAFKANYEQMNSEDKNNVPLVNFSIGSLNKIINLNKN